MFKILFKTSEMAEEHCKIKIDTKKPKKPDF